jgi:metal-responsive CopG/Arc/MetJ family transcriptional regulator
MKERITVTIEKNLLGWLDDKISQHVFANRSHGFEFLIAERIREETSGKVVKNDW